VLSGHEGGGWSVAFSPDGRHIVTASSDGTARVWDVTDPAEPQVVGVLSGHSGGMWSAAFSPDGRHIVTANSDGTARLWNDVVYPDFIAYACTRVFRDFTPEERLQYGLDDTPTCPQFATPAP
jgi:WD40 repeat protein